MYYCGRTNLGPTLIPKHWHGRGYNTADIVPPLGAHKAAYARLLLQEYRIELSIATFVSHWGGGCLPQLEKIGCLQTCGNCQDDGCHIR